MVRKVLANMKLKKRTIAIVHQKKEKSAGNRHATGRGGNDKCVGVGGGEWTTMFQ